jgi:hypothetical protein
MGEEEGQYLPAETLSEGEWREIVAVELTALAGLINDPAFSRDNFADRAKVLSIFAEAIREII